MANGYGPIALAGYVQQQGELGRQRGQQNRLAQLASQAYGAPAQERRGLVQQAIQTDPAAGFALGQSLEQDRGQQMGSLSQKARMLVEYAKAGNQAGVQGLYPQLAAEAQQLGLGQGIPQEWDDAYLPGIEQLAMMGGADTGNTIHSQRVLADGRIMNTYRDGRTEITDHRADIQSWMRDHPGMEPHLVRRSGEVVPLAQQGSPGAPVPQGQGQQFVDDSVELANQMIAAGIPAEQVDAFLQHRLSQGAAPDAGAPSPAQPASMAPQPASGVPTRPSEGQVAAEQERARQQVQLDYLPARQQVEAVGAGLREGAVLDSRTAAERRAELPLARSSTENAKNGLARMAQTAREIRDNPALSRITGVMGQIPDMPGSEAANVRAQLENTLRSQVGFGVLQAMRDASKTGGALGQVSNVENILLQENLAALANTQSPEALRTQLDKIIQYAEDAQDRLDQAFRETYGDTDGGAPASSGPQPGAVEGGYRFRGGDPADPNNWERI